MMRLLRGFIFIMHFITLVLRSLIRFICIWAILNCNFCSFNSSALFVFGGHVSELCIDLYIMRVNIIGKEELYNLYSFIYLHTLGKGICLQFLTHSKVSKDKFCHFKLE